MLKRISHGKTYLAQPRNLALLLTILTISALRLFWLPGYSFNQHNWDDEISWVKESNSKSPVEYLLYRDAPGYFVFVPRLMILLGEICPQIGSISSLRLLVIASQLLCFAAAVTCAVKWKNNWKLWLILFVTFSLTYIEDLNYVHNVGYLFIFPVIFFVFSRITTEQPVKSYHVGLSVILISKPFTALLVLILSLFFYTYLRHSRNIFLTLGLYSAVYLAAYVLLPHRWDTPFDVDVATIIKLFVDLPWIFITILLPAFSMGVMGLTRVLDLPLMRDILGIASYSLLILGTWLFRRKIYFEFIKASILTKGIYIIFITNYALVFSVSDSYWIQNFPLYRLDSPQFLWMRWSSLLPFFALLIISHIQSISLRIKMYLYLFIAGQWFLLALFGNTWFKRYW